MPCDNELLVLEVIALTNCASSVDVEANVLDANGTVVGFTNDMLE